MIFFKAVFLTKRNNTDVVSVGDSVNKNSEKREDARRLIALVYVGVYLFTIVGFIGLDAG